MRRALTAIGLYGAAVLAAVACHDAGSSACFEDSGAVYPVAAPGDSTVIFRWPGSYYPVRYYAEPVGALQANVDSGLVLWLNAFHCGELSVQRVTDSTTADVIIRNPALLPPLTTGSTVVFADSVGACIGRTDIALDSLNRLERPVRAYVAPQNPDTVAVSGCYHFVTAHEIGHTLGLFSHSPNPVDLMFVRPRRRVLSTDDRYTIQQLYHFGHIVIVPQPR
jgi:hypothetical protein